MRHVESTAPLAQSESRAGDSARRRRGLAELLLEHYPDKKPAALGHLDFAIGEFREMKMQPSLERGLRHKEILGA